MRKLILLEINEVPHRIYDLYRKENPDSALAKLLNQSVTYTTLSTDQGELHPWSTWPTLHRGVDNTIHNIRDIGEDLESVNQKYPPIWDILVQHKIKTGVFSSLHTFPLPAQVSEYDFLVPDPFATGPMTHPEKIQPFQAFNLSMTQKSGRSVHKGIDLKSALKLAVALPGLGIKVKTGLKIFRQLISERAKPWRTTRRRSFQAILAFDLYMKLLKKHKPQFTTFFSNHVASALHRYWAASFPEDYENMSLPVEWLERYKEEIPFCMDELNQMVESLVKFLDNNSEYKLIIAGSMGQAATTAELIKTEVFFGNPQQFIHHFSEYEISLLPAMHPQYNFKVSKNPDEFEKLLETFTLNDYPVIFRRKESTFSIDLGYRNINNVHITINGQVVIKEDLGIEIKEIDDQSSGNAYHIPEGALYIYDPLKPVEDSEKKSVDLRSIAPAILRNYGLQPPAHMCFDNIFEI